MDYFDFYIRHEYTFAAIQLFSAMIGMGATLKPIDFAEVVRSPRGVLAGLVIQIIGVPLLTLLFLRGLDLDPGLAIGLALVAAIPGGTVSNIFTFMARGHTALSIVLTATTTLACLVTTPWILKILAADAIPADIEMPAGQIALDIGLYLLLPLFLGMILNTKWPAIAPRFSKFCIHFSLLTVLAIVVGAHGAGRIDVEAFGMNNIQIVSAFTLAMLIFGVVAPRLAGLGKPDCAAISFEVSVRSVNLAILIKASLFPAVAGQLDPVGDNILFTALQYGGFSMVTGLLLLAAYRYIIPKPVAAAG